MGQFSIQRRRGFLRKCIIEQLKKTDAENLKKMVGIAGMNFYPKQLDKFLSEKQNLVFIAKVDGEIIGLLYGYTLMRMDTDKPQFFIYSVDIHPDYQNKGYGTQLVQYSVDYANENNYCESFVITDKNNVRACKVYEKAGGKHTDEDCDRVYVMEC